MSARPATSVGSSLSSVRVRLAEAGCETADLDARLMVQETLGLSWADLIARPDAAIDPEAGRLLDERVARRVTGEPVHRILGYRPFYGLDLRLSPETLEPRPDTETLVEAMRPHAAASVARSGVCRILDLGTGTGAIALALLSVVPAAVATGTDIAPGALRTAEANAAALGLGGRFRALESSWLRAVEGAFDLIVSNPPYIRRAEIDALDEGVRRHDPLAALDGGADGLDAYRAIAEDAHHHLAEGGAIGLEIGHDQRVEVTAVFEDAGYRLIGTQADLAGRDRVLVFQRM